jgi:hypothetical protein
MTMKITKSLMLAAVTALSLGVGTAMAQESAGGVNAGPYETAQLNKMLAQQTAAANARAATASIHAPQFGSSDRTSTTNWTVLGADGNGG